MNKTKRLTTMAVFIAIGTIGAQILWFPAGVARAYPIQHVVNVMAGVMLGPGPAVIIAFLIALLRNMLGLGTLMAFPGGMFGAFAAGLLYKKFHKKGLAVTGEAIGSGIIGSFAAVPISNLFLGTSIGALFFVPSFVVSSISGALIGWFILSRFGNNIHLK